MPSKITHKANANCKVCNGTGWNHGAQYGASKPGYNKLRTVLLRTALSTNASVGQKE